MSTYDIFNLPCSRWKTQFRSWLSFATGKTPCIWVKRAKSDAVTSLAPNPVSPMSNCPCHGLFHCNALSHFHCKMQILRQLSFHWSDAKFCLNMHLCSKGLHLATILRVYWSWTKIQCYQFIWISRVYLFHGFWPNRMFFVCVRITTPYYPINQFTAPKKLFTG